jgi:hypothetical protein
MKKIIVTLTLALVIAGTVSAQNQWPDINTYAETYVAQFGTVFTDWKKGQIYETDPVENAKYATLGGKAEFLDTPLEMAVYAYYSPKADPAPPAAEKILPHSNPRLVDRQLGAAVYKELAVARFLNTAAAVSKYEAMLTFITGRGNAARAEIEAFYRQNIGALIAAEVDAQFNRVDFGLDVRGVGSYNVVLTRDAKNQYILSYERPSVENDDKTLSAPTLEALLAEMRKNTADFSQTSIDTVRAQAALMPAEIYAAWQPLGVDTKALVTIKADLTAFFLAPNATNYEKLCGIWARYYKINNNVYNAVNSNVQASFSATLMGLSMALVGKIEADVTPKTYIVLATRPKDAKYDIFGTPYVLNLR